MLEGMVMMATCDKVVPGMLMGALRVNIPTVMMTGGYMAAGHYQGRMLTLTHTKQGLCSVYRRRYVGRGLQRHCAQCMSNTGGIPFMGNCEYDVCNGRNSWIFPHGAASCRSQTEKWHELKQDRRHVRSWKHGNRK